MTAIAISNGQCSVLMVFGLLAAFDIVDHCSFLIHFLCLAFGTPFSLGFPPTSLHVPSKAFVDSSSFLYSLYVGETQNSVLETLLFSTYSHSCPKFIFPVQVFLPNTRLTSNDYIFAEKAKIYLKTNTYNTELLNFLPKPAPPTAFPFTNDGKFILPVAQTKILEFSVTLFFLSYSVSSPSASSMGFIFKTHPESDQFLLSLLYHNGLNHHHLFPCSLQ